MKRLIINIIAILGLLFNTFGQSSQNNKNVSLRCKTHVTISDTLGCDSIVMIYYPNGQLYFKVPYKNGFQNGWKEDFHQNGSIIGKELMVNGKVVDGLNIFYWDNGIIAQKGFNKNGVQVGKWYHYTKEGDLFKLYYYKRNGQIKRVKEWNPIKKKWIKSGLI